MKKISASADRRAKNVVVVAVFISKLELCDVEREILSRYLVESPDHTALYQGPEALNGLGVDRANNILARA